MAAPTEALVAGHLLATMTALRIPVFLLQSMQASYVVRVAQQAHAGRSASLRRTLSVLGGLVLTAAVGTVLTAWVGQCSAQAAQSVPWTFTMHLR